METCRWPASTAHGDESCDWSVLVALPRGIQFVCLAARPPACCALSRGRKSFCATLESEFAPIRARARVIIMRALEATLLFVAAAASTVQLVIDEQFNHSNFGPPAKVPFGLEKRFCAHLASAHCASCASARVSHLLGQKLIPFRALLEEEEQEFDLRKKNFSLLFRSACKSSRRGGKKLKDFANNN